MFINRKCFIFSVIISLFIGVSQPVSAQTQDTQKGKASWYGSQYHGKKTSSGERYNKHAMTAAHKTLPFGTMVKVTNLDNDETVIVRINDRGPFVGKRIIDVSEAAARKLEIRSQGTGQVKIEVLNTPSDIASAEGFKFDIAEFTNYGSALEATPGFTVSNS